MRVVSGELGGRKLTVPAGDRTRPTAERVREAIFNSLYSLDAVEDAVVIDVFAGSGALGIEALSRGASHATLVEQDRGALRAIETNVETLGLAQRASVVPADGLAYLERTDGFDLVLLDPPYGFDEWERLLAAIHDAVVVIESDREVGLPESWVVHRCKRYGSTVVTLATAGPTGSTTS